MIKNKYILIDSGIDLKNDIVSKNIEGGVSFYLNKDGKIESSDLIQDKNGHGTMCSSIISNIYKESSPYVVKIINEDGKTRFDVLTEALNHCLKIDIDIICLSMATVNTKAYNSINVVCNKLRDRGKIIINSTHNNFYESLPAVLKSVIGVIGNDFNGSRESFWFNSGYDIQACFDGLPHFAYTLNKKVSLFKGNSKATALMVGNILKFIDENKFSDYSGLIKYLNEKTLKKNWMMEEISIKKPFVDLKDTRKLDKLEIEIGNELVYIINNSFEKDICLDDLFNWPLLSKRTGLNFNNCYFFLKEVEAHFGLNIDFMELNAMDFCTMERLINLIKGF